MNVTFGIGEQEHRRGFVLGLTLAEALLLLVFVLLLALAGVAGEMEQKAVAAEERAVSLTRELTDWRRVEEALKPALDGASAIADRTAGGGGAVFLRRLAEAEADRQALDVARDRIAALEADLAEQKKKVAERSEITSLIEAASRVDPAASPTASLRKGLAALKDLAGPEKAEPAIQVATDPPERDLAEINRKLIEDNRRLALENESMRQHGTTFPSCWTADDGEADFMFDLTVTDSGIIVRDVTPAARRNDPVRELIESFEGGVRMSPTRFQTATAPLFQWSQERRCRFFVVLRDGTGPASKTSYQRMRRVIEGHFYIRHRW